MWLLMLNTYKNYDNLCKIAHAHTNVAHDYWKKNNCIFFGIVQKWNEPNQKSFD